MYVHMLKKSLSNFASYLGNHRRFIMILIILFIVSVAITLAAGKIYQHLDKDSNRGAVAIQGGAFGESYSTPIYLDQGWDPSDSLWYYNTTQGSVLLPYDFFIALEQSNSEELFRSDLNIDKYRYLPQYKTFFNPDALPVGFVKDTYKGNDYIGYTCAACHTSQINFKSNKTDELTAIRIDGGPAMADMVGFLTALEKAMKVTLQDKEKFNRFSQKVIDFGSDYSEKDTVEEDLVKWIKTINQYNQVNLSHVEYGYARLDAFGRIYNRVLKHVLNKRQAESTLLTVIDKDGTRILTADQVDKVLDGVDETVIGDAGFVTIVDRLLSDKDGLPGLTYDQLEPIKNAFFNEPDAPVSYPFLWDIAQSDYVQWNALAANAGVGPLGRNAGEVIGVFGKLDWTAKTSGFSLGALITGQRSLGEFFTNQKRTKPYLDFESSINLVNLERLEAHLQTLMSPKWPENILGKHDPEKVARGELIYMQYCQSCHEVVERNDYHRKVVGKMSDVKVVGTDPAMVTNSVTHTGKSGNFKHTYQSIEGVGDVIIEDTAPVVQILTAATKGVVATPDADKFFLRRWADWFYTLGMSFYNNGIKPSIKDGHYIPDTTAKSYSSLTAYKARSLNGIWATAPYLHNGSVPSLYDLLLPKKKKTDPVKGEYRPDKFMVGSRKFDAKNVGFIYEGFDGFVYDTSVEGNLNTGHEYAAGNTALSNGKTLNPLTEKQRWDLVEYLKTL